MITARLRHFAAVLVLAGMTLVAQAPLALADVYLLGAGDNLRLEHSGAPDPIELTIDADGQVRVPALGGVRIAGLSLDKAETEIERRMAADGVFVNPAVSLQVRAYAPVVVGGDVLNPGRFAYVPGMTVAGALALSGGGQAQGLTRGEVARAQAEVEAGLRTANLDIALAVAQLARFEAMLAGPDTRLDVTALQRRRVPLADMADLDGIIRTEAALLASERRRGAQLLSFWESEIATIEAQAQNFDARIEVQQEIVTSALANLEASQLLTDRGLQTVAGLATAEQREADARSRVLELEGAKIAAARAVSSAKRERISFLTGQERDALAGMQDAKKYLETAAYRYQRFEAQRATLSGVLAGSVFDSEAVRITFTLQSVRSDRPQSDEITPDTFILPGEILIVSLAPMVDDLDG